MPTHPFPTVQGRCPSCGGTSLFLGEGGYVTCSWIDCPEPNAASTLLERDVRAETLTVKVFGATRPPCKSGRHEAHPGWDCEEQDALADAWRKAFADGTIRWINPPRRPSDLAPLRRLAKKALAAVRAPAP